MSLLRRLREATGLAAPAELDGLLERDEDVLGAATAESGGRLVVTPLGLWLPESAGMRRVDWHLVSKATWSEGTLAVIEADEVEWSGDAVILADREPVYWPLGRPGRVPELVRRRVESSIRARHRKELPGGGAWFVLRKLPGGDGVVLQARPDPGADRATVAAIAHEAAAELRPPEM